MSLKCCILVTLLYASSCWAEGVLRQVEESLHQKCLKNANEEAYQEILNVLNDMESCHVTSSDYVYMLSDVITAQFMGNINEVSKRHCNKIQQTVSCAKAIICKSEKCLSENERTAIRIVSNITITLIGEVCNNEGNFINEFAAKGGPVCLGMKKMEMLACLETFGPVLEGESYIDKISAMKYDTAECEKLSDLKKCLIGEIAWCINPPISKMVNDLVTSALKVTPCQSFEENDQSIKTREVIA